MHTISEKCSRYTYPSPPLVLRVSQCIFFFLSSVCLIIKMRVVMSFRKDIGSVAVVSRFLRVKKCLFLSFSL